MAVVTAEGIAKPFDLDGDPYPAFGTRAPALRSFRLIPVPNDHKIALVQVLAGRPFGGSLAERRPAARDHSGGRLHVLLQDAHPAGEEFGSSSRIRS